jgi:hypothetical protein
MPFPAMRPAGTGVPCFFYDLGDGVRCGRPAGRTLFCSTAHHQDRWKLLTPETQVELNNFCTNPTVNKNAEKYAELYDVYRRAFGARQLADAVATVNSIATMAEQEVASSIQTIFESRREHQEQQSASAASLYKP